MKAKSKAKSKSSTIKDLFDFTIAGYTKPNMWVKKYYTSVLHGRQVNRGTESRVVIMDGKDFLKNSFSKTNVLKEKIRTKASLKDLVKKRKFALPYIDITRKKGFGRGRVLMCLKNDVKEVPVLLVGTPKGEIDKWLKGKKIKVKKV